MKNNKHLFIFTIGPVQSFIAESRKTQDLYAGSLLLSVLLKKGIEQLEEKGFSREAVIFPYAFPDDDAKWKSVKSLPNRFVAVVEAEKDDLKKLGNSIERAVQEHWKSKAVMDAFRCSPESKISIHKGAIQQIEQHLDIFWLFEPLSDNYKASFKELERKMGGLKNIRTFKQYDYANYLGERGRKCSLDGIRNVKFYRMTETQERDKVKARLLFANDNCVFDHDAKLSQRILQSGEGLSAVSFVKRCFLQQKGTESFPSTADIALKDWLQSIDQNKLAAYKALISSKEYDAQLFFEESLNEEYLSSQGISFSLPKEEKEKTAVEYAREKLKELVKSTDLKQSKYYAIIAFDGDSMGEWLSRADNKEMHKEFSKLLIDFACHAEDKKKEYGCEIIYAGGDDFLAFVNLSDLFDALIWLRNQFNEMIGVKAKEMFNREHDFSFSAGIAIAHYKEQLKIVLKKAKAMEDKAKDLRKEKNAFAISVIKGSGEEHEMAWGLNDQSLEQMKWLVSALQREDLSTTFITNIQREFSRLVDWDSGSYSSSPKMKAILKIELKRLVLKSLITTSDSEKEKVVKSLYYFLANNSGKVRNFFEMLNVVNFLHRSYS